MAPCQNLLVIFLGWSYICGGCCLMLDKCFTGLKRKTELRELESAGNEDADVLLQETVSEHMQMLYEKYNRAGFHFKDGNTVRSFKAHWGTINSTEMQVFNLTPLTKSEDIMSVTLHYFTGGSQTSSARCARLKACGRRGPGQAHIRLSIWSSTSEGNNTRTLGHATIRVPLRHGDSVSWQWKDITAIVMEAKGHNELLIGVEVPPEGCGTWSDLVAGHPPYILVYANDSDISGAESAVSALERRKDVPLERGLLQLGTHLSDGTAGQGRGRGRGRRRHRRSANVLLPLQNNELPESEYPYEGPRWDGPDSYSPAAKHPSRRPKKKPRKSRRHRVPLLQFDEQTVQRAQHRQWSESRSCSRRYLKVDFADIGWSEWIISPKSFDAYYCSGSCQFPMPKSLKPSNHATIQSIVRAVGVVPGIPEPCCVPEKMSPLSILFFDQDKNVVLKVYPNMTVDSCVCR